jgi:hypothetical protein
MQCAPSTHGGKHSINSTELSKVLHIRGLPSLVTEDELVEVRAILMITVCLFTARALFTIWKCDTSITSSCETARFCANE